MGIDKKSIEYMNYAEEKIEKSKRVKKLWRIFYEDRTREVYEVT